MAEAVREEEFLLSLHEISYKLGEDLHENANIATAMEEEVSALHNLRSRREKLIAVRMRKRNLKILILVAEITMLVLSI